MKNIIISIILTFALLALPTVFAHDENDYQDNENYISRGLMNNLMWNNKDNDEILNDMNKMHELMWSEDNLTQEEFEWFIKEQKEHMGWSWIESSYDDVDSYNKWISEKNYQNKNKNNNQRGHGCPMWK